MRTTADARSFGDGFPSLQQGGRKEEGMQARTEERQSKKRLTGGSQLGRSVGRSVRQKKIHRSRGYFSCMLMRKRAKTRNAAGRESGGKKLYSWVKTMCVREREREREMGGESPSKHIRS